MALTRPRYSQIPDSDYKNSCRIVTTTNITLSSGAPQTYDGVTLVQYDRVLVAGQTDKTKNGIYSVQTVGSGSNGTWVRSKDANANEYLTAGMNTFIEEGTYAGQFWHLLTVNPIVLGVTELIFGQISGNAAGISSQVQYNLNGSIAGAANLRYDSVTGNVLIGNGTAATSNVTGALVVNGGIGVTGEVWTYGNMYSAGSRVLTTHDLETVTFTANYISKDPANVAVPVVGTGTIYGTHDFGNLEAISTYGDYNTTAQTGYYSVHDATGAPGWVVYIGFTGISSFNRAVYNINYTASSGHTVDIDMYNYATDTWDTFAVYSGSGNWQQFALGVIDHIPYISNTGNVTSRIYHVSSGNVSHRTWIDYVALEQSVTGGQGPRGATGATGATGPAGTYSGGFIISNVTVGNTIISNSGNVSISTTTGAIILTGNGGIGLGGNIFAGGNVTANAFYTINGLFWSSNGQAFSSGLEVSEINTSNVLSNVSTQVTSLRFDRDTGFNVTELNPGNVKISLGSSFKTWHVPGQSDLVAVAEDEVTFFGNGIDITTNPVYPKALTFIANNKVLEANIGSFYTYANANIGTLYLGNISTQANLGAFYTYANANIGTLFLGNASTQANLGAFQVFSNANAASQQVSINTINANIGAFYTYANANIGTLYLGNVSTQANLGAFQTYANTTFGGVFSEISSLYVYIDANAGIQSANIQAINANIGAFYAYANSKIGTNNNSNLVVASTTDSVSTLTGALVVKGGVGIGGNLYIGGNIYAQNTVSINSTTLEVTDPLLYLAASDPYPYNYDIGFYSHFVDGVDPHYQHTGIVRDYSTGIWGFFSNVSTEPGTTINWAEGNLIYDAVRLGDLIVSNTTQSTSTTTGALRVAGGAGIAGALYIANTGDVSANIGTLFLGNASTQANLGAYQNTTNANIGTLFLGNASTQANLGAFQIYANANIGTLFLGNASTQANLGAYQTYANLALTTLNTSLSNFSTYANLYLGISETFVVTNSGSSAYIINGQTNPALYLIRGQTYNFSIDSAGHPLWIKTVASIGSGDQYNTGVTNNGADSGILTFTVPLDAPDVLYYVSQFDAAMTNELRVVNFSTLDANIGTLFLGNASTQANLGAFQTYTNANIGTLFLGNASTQANLGAFQTYANSTFTTYSNANAYAYLPTHTGNITAGNIVVTSKVSADKFYTTNGIYWSGNGAPYSASGSSISYTASTTPPVSPVKGDQWYDTVEAILYEYMDDGDTNQWVDIISPTFSGASPIAYDSAVRFGSNITVEGNIFITKGIFWTSNGDPYATGGGGSFSGSDDVLRANVGAYEIYANANIGTLYLGNISTNANLGAFQTYANARFSTLDANIGTLYLGNVSTQANLGAFQTFSNANAAAQAVSINTINANIGEFHNYANTKIGTNTNSNLVVVATTTSTNTTTGALVVGGGVGIAGTLNVGSSGTFAGLLQTTATTPSTSSGTGALYVAGGAGIVGNLHADGNVILGSGTSSNVVVKATTGSSSTTTGALVVRGGVGISGDVWVGTGLSVGDNLTVTNSAYIGEVRVDSATESRGVTTGALRVPNNGGIGVTGNIHAKKLYTVQGLFWSGNGAAYTVPGTFNGNVVATGNIVANGNIIATNGNIVAASGTASTDVTTGALVVAGTGGLGVGGDLNATAGSTVNGWTVGGLLWAACTTPATSTTSGGLKVSGGAGVSGNLYVGNEFVVPGGGKITASGISNFLEKANVVVSSPAITINVDLSTVSVMYWTSNATSNMTANIRGDATTPLNNVLSVGQSITTVLFIPNGISNYYINTLKIDNTTITPAYSGNTTPTLGNPNSIDIYSFTILKTADATYKVFATQSQFQHPG